MHEPQLTIGVPTYNRADRLARQLEWLTSARDGYEDVCEVVISDNASTDHTAKVVEDWRERQGGHNIRLLRNSANVGAVKNVAQCISVASGRHVWVIGDDDEIAEGTLALVLRTLEADPQLALLILNYGMQDAATGRVLFDRCFTIEGEYREEDGGALFERCLAVPRTVRWGGLGFTTALVYRTTLARQALWRWPAGLENLAFQVYISGVCAFSGPAALTRESLLQCAAGGHHFSNNARVQVGFWSADMAEMFVALMRVGCSPTLCLRRIIERPKSFLPVVPEALRRWPGYTLWVLARYTVAVVLGVVHAATAARSSR